MEMNEYFVKDITDNFVILSANADCIKIKYEDNNYYIKNDSLLYTEDLDIKDENDTLDNTETDNEEVSNNQ